MKRLLGSVLLLACAQAFGQCIPSGVTDQYTYFVAVDATDLNTRETGLSSFTVRRSRNGGASAAFTTPTINETDTTNMPGVYELLLDEDMTIDSGDDVQHMTVHITHAGMAPVTKEFCIARAKITAGNTLAVAADGDLLEVNTLTGNTAQTGDSFARLGAPAGASHAADNAAIKSDTAAILVDTSTTLDDLVDDLEARIGTPTNFGSGTSTLAANLQDLADNGTAVFDRSTDSLQAIRDRGDAAWTTGGGGGDPSIQSTTVASVTSQTILVPAATPTFVDQINGWGVYLEDAGDGDAYHLTYVTNYDQSNGEVTIAEAAPFTVAASDTMVFLPAFMDQGVNVTAWNGTNLATTNPLPNAAPGGAGGLPTVNASNQVVGVQVFDEDTTAIDVNATTVGTATNLTNLPGIPANWLTAAGTAADFGTEVGNATWATTTRVLTAGTNIVLAKGVGITGLNDLSSADAQAAALAALTSIHLDHLLAADYDPASKPGVSTALLNEVIESDAGVSRFTANALEQAPAGGGGGTSDWTAGEREQLRHRLGIDGAASAPAATPSLATSAEVATRASQTSVDDVPTNAELATALGTADDAVLAAVATRSSQASVDDLPTNAEFNAALAAADDPTLAAIAALPAAIRDTIDEDQGPGYSRACINSVLMAFAAGNYVTSGNTTTWRDPSNSEIRFVTTVSESGRTSSSISCPTH